MKAQLSGVVQIRALHINCIIGILPQERVTPQPLYLDVDLSVDFAAAAASDDIADAVNYAEVAERLQTLAVTGQFQLVECYVSRACEQLLAQWPVVTTVAITVKKPQAVAAAGHVGVFLERHR